MDTGAELAGLLGPALVPPPVEWAAIERALGTTLPADYREWAARYPATELDRRLLLAHPASAEPGTNLVALQDRVLVARGTDRPTGLIAWGFDEDGFEYFWRTGGDPRTWPVVVIDGLEEATFPLGFTGFLTELLSRRLRHRMLMPGRGAPLVDFLY